KHIIQVSYLYCFLFFSRASRRAITCFSLKERLPLVLTFSLCLIIMKFFFLLFSLLLVLACGFSLVRLFMNSFLSVRPA
uniref:Uncharacterized protein n=2 Tax=Amphiprion TaxID=80969 RepID=A0A3Q1CUG1_AMPOC